MSYKRGIPNRKMVGGDFRSLGASGCKAAPSDFARRSAKTEVRS